MNRTQGPDTVLADGIPSLPDRRLVEVCETGTPWTLRSYASQTEWETRAAYIRRHILACAGLWPLPERPPLRPRVFGRIDREGYSVEKVYFHSLPGFYVGGNLYRPPAGGELHPGIACPHGHWAQGRLEDGPMGSIPGRCIELARRGCVAFSYDMAGYNDSDQVDHRQFGGRREDLWGIGLLGLQLWNSIRAVDFLQGLEDVDADRIGCTGASGGGTQTFLLTAVDDRVSAAACVNMVSAHFQGGCTCENQGHLRLEINNVEIAAVAAPRPLLLVAATGDWTVNTPDVEYPAVRAVYRLYGAEERVSTRQFDAPHNYNRDSREAVYAFFARWLQGGTSRRVRERAFTVEKKSDLLVFADHPRPPRAMQSGDLVEALIRRSEKRLQADRPRDRSSLKRLRQGAGVAFGHALAASYPEPAQIRERSMGRSQGPKYLSERLLLGTAAGGERVPAVLFSPRSGPARMPAALICHPDGKAGLMGGAQGGPLSLVRSLLAAGHRVLVLDAFLTGEADRQEWREAYRQDVVPHFATYNRSVAACRIQDILIGLGYLRSRDDVGARSLVGLGHAGILCLLARAMAEDVARTWVEVAGFDFGGDADWLEKCDVPGLRSAGDARTALGLIAPGHLHVRGASRSFPSAWARGAYRAAGGARRLTIARRRGNHKILVGWLTRG